MGAIKDIYDILSDMTAKAKTPAIKEEVERLRSSVSELAADNAKLTAENTELKTQVAKLQPAPHDGTLEPIKVEMLKVLAGTEEAESTLIASRLKLVLAVAQMHILELRDSKFIWGDNSGWHITPTGTRYLVDRGHLQ